MDSMEDLVERKKGDEPAEHLLFQSDLEQETILGEAERMDP